MPVIVEHYPELDDLFTPLRIAADTQRGHARRQHRERIADRRLDAGADRDRCGARAPRRGRLPRNRARGLLSDYRVNELRPGEFVERIRLPLPAADSQVQSYKVSKRFDQDISAVCGAFRLELENDHVAVIAHRLRWHGRDRQRASPARRHSPAALVEADTIEAGMAALDTDYVPIGDMRASASYRAAVCRNLLRRFYPRDPVRHGIGVRLWAAEPGHRRRGVAARQCAPAREWAGHVYGRHAWSRATSCMSPWA